MVNRISARYAPTMPPKLEISAMFDAEFKAGSAGLYEIRHSPKKTPIAKYKMPYNSL